MTVHNVDIPTNVEPMLLRFARFLAQSDELTDEIDTSVDISVREWDENSVRAAGRQYVHVKEHGNDGYELVQQTENGVITGYAPEGTSKVGKAVQDLADEFFGHHNYSCTFYEDEHTSKTTITP